MLRQKKPTLQATVQELHSAITKFGEAAAAAHLCSADLRRLAKFSKRLVPLLDETADISGLDAAAEQQGVQAFQNVKQSLQQLTSFAGQCSSIGPVYALLEHIPLAQKLANCSIDLCNALAAVDAAALRVSTDLQEDLSQHVRQLQRTIGCNYSQPRHSTLLELYLQAEAVRAGKVDASTLSAILTQQVLQQCTVAQLAADVAYLQQAAAEQQQTANHVAASFYQQLAIICKALLPADCTASGGFVPVLQRLSDHQTEEQTMSAAELLVVLTQPQPGNRNERLQATLALANALTTNVAAMPAELAAVTETAELPKAATCDVLQILSDPSAIKACIGVIASTAVPGQQAADAQQDILVKQATAYALERAVAAEPEVSSVLVSCEGCLASLVKLVLAGSTASSTPDLIKVAVLELLCTLCKTEAAAARSESCTATGTSGRLLIASTNDMSTAVATLAASKQLVEQHKVIPALVQLLGEVKVVKGRAAVSLSQRPAAAAADTPGTQKGSSSVTGSNPAATGKAAKGSVKGAAAAAAATKARVAGRAADAGCATAAVEEAAPKFAVGPSLLPCGPSHTAVVMAALRLLHALSDKYRVTMQAAGVMPALASLLAAQDSEAAALHLDAVALLVVLLQLDKAAALDAMRTNMLPVLASLFKHCLGSSDSRGLQQALKSALLLLLNPPVEPAAAAAAFGSFAPANEQQPLLRQAAVAHGTAAVGLGQPLARPALAGGGARRAQSTCSEVANACTEIGKCCSTASLVSVMQLLSLGPALGSELTLHLLQLLLSATHSQEARASVFAHKQGMASVISHAASAQTPVWSRTIINTAADAPEGSATVAATAAALLVHIGQDQQIKPQLAQPLAEVLLGGSAEQRASAAWLVSRLAACRTEADKVTARAAAELCKQLDGAVAPVLELLRSSSADQKGAGVVAVRALATFGDASLQGSLLAGGAVPALVDVLRSSGTAGEPLAAAATSALGALATAAVPGAGAAVCDLLVSCLQPSSAAVAAKVAEALLDMAGALPDTASYLIQAGALPACLKLVHECSADSHSLEACRGAARLLAWLLRCSSSSSSSNSCASNNNALTRIISSSSSHLSAAGKRDASRPVAVAAISDINTTSTCTRSDLPPSTVSVMLSALCVRDDAVRLPAAAALGQLLRRPAAVADREAAVAAQAVTELLDVLRSTAPSTTSVTSSSSASAGHAVTDLRDWAWDDAAAGAACLGALHGTACADLARALRQMTSRGGPKDASTAAVVAASLAASPRGRVALLSEGVLAGLVGVVGNPACSAAARAAAADAIGNIAVPSSVMLDTEADGSGDAAGASGKQPPNSSSAGIRAQGSPVRQLPQKQGLPAGARTVDPKLEAVRAGAVAALVGLVKSGAGQVCVLEAAESLYILAGCQAGRDAALAAGARDALQEVVLAGKRRQVGEKVAKAAYEALMRFL